jgi:hypothetical protein
VPEERLLRQGSLMSGVISRPDLTRGTAVNGELLHRENVSLPRWSRLSPANASGMNSSVHAEDHGLSGLTRAGICSRLKGSLLVKEFHR